MTSTAGDGLLATIRSRSQRFRMQPLVASDLEAVLLSQGIAPPQAAACHKNRGIASIGCFAGQTTTSRAVGIFGQGL